MSLRGNLSHFGVPDVLQLLAGQGKTGILRLERPGEKAAFVFAGGEIVSTWDRAFSSTDPLKTYILRTEALPKRHLMRGLRLEPRSELPFAQILVREGVLDLPELARILREQVREQIREVLRWEEGRFEFTQEPSVRAYGPGCAVKVESVLLQAAHEIDEDAGREPPEEAPQEPLPVEKPGGRPVARPGFLHALSLLLVPAAAFVLSGFLVPPASRPDDHPPFAARVVAFQTEREIRNLRLVLEMYRSLFERYPATLGDLVHAGLLSPTQVADLRNHDVRYRALRGGGHYVLHSGRYGPLVRLLPDERHLPDPFAELTSRVGSLRRTGLDRPAP
ncbi:MAG: DUF4388 domain-containing protein [Candidatus Eisenbacteria bacterium]|nr:DUF4388 domain-containing protein [Candidatus Eisenbacteria bacterium]